MVVIHVNFPFESLLMYNFHTQKITTYTLTLHHNVSINWD